MSSLPEVANADNIRPLLGCDAAQAASRLRAMVGSVIDGEDAAGRDALIQGGGSRLRR